MTTSLDLKTSDILPRAGAECNLVQELKRRDVLRAGKKDVLSGRPLVWLHQPI